VQPQPGEAMGLEAGQYLTAVGVRALAVIVFTIWMWLAVNTTWSNLLFFALLIMTGTMTPGAVWSGSIGHFAPMLIIVFTIIGQCLAHTGAIDRIAIWFMTRKMVRGRPYVFMAMFFFSLLFMGMFMQNLALTILFLDLTIRVCDKIGIQKGHSLYTALMMGVVWGVGIISIASPIAKTLPNVLIGLLDVQLGITVTYAQWFMIGVPYTLLMFIFIMVCTRLNNPDVSPLKNLDIDELERNAPKMGLDGKIALAVMAVLVLFILLPDILVMFLTPGTAAHGFAAYFVRVSANVPAILAVVALCVITTKKDGKSVPVMDFNKCAAGVPIGMILFIGAAIVMGSPLGSPATGITPWLGGVLQPVLGGFGITTIIILLTLGALIMTNFVSNLVTMTLFFNVGVAVLAGTAANLGAFAVLMSFAATMATLTPSAAMTQPLFFGPGHITVANSYKINLIFLAITFLVMILFLPLVGIIVPMP